MGYLNLVRPHRMASRNLIRRNADQDIHRKPSGQPQSSALPHVKGFKKHNHPSLPIIDLSSGPNISNIEDALLHHCEQDLGPISRKFEESQYDSIPIPTCDPDTLELTNDPQKINRDRHLARLKQWDIDTQKYEESKPKLFGLIWSMTTKELDERVNEHLNATSTSRNSTATASATGASTTAASTTVATETLAPTGCPLTFWKAIVHVTTTRANGNIMIDQDNVCISFALIKQKPTESVADYKRRFSNILDSHAIVSVPLKNKMFLQ